ncbi:AraC family transcriptional regulator [Nguyenibacter vanlangensis]|uniref:AraC family transcriptional regulator n=1 Tax=Nguyenibacter vanlangensis TaxID=1216886 RepID=A0A7Y7M3G4_9PROT|nr:AraC family transcriptional regulator [Nguyenibacter vanlangensis]NVN09670.1 AraC family transcriptional regulator [Nguyenibacter vanlangensis]
MIDPLAEVVTLLQPSARYAKLVVGAGPWHIRRSDAGQPFYCVVLEGACCLAIDRRETIELRSGDFILVPEAYGVAMTSIMPASADSSEAVPVALGGGEFRIGDQDGPPDLRMLAGHCGFGSPDADLLVSLLPQVVHVRGEPRLATLVQLVRDEFRDRRPAREVILTHLLEVLLIEALRSTAATPFSPGLVRGLADERLAMTLRRMHESPTKTWTVAQLAKEAALSRSAFFERFSRVVGLAPMAYLLNWRMALAKNMLRRSEVGIAEIAQRVGYGSASAFSVAFTRHVGLPPARYARQQSVPAP